MEWKPIETAPKDGFEVLLLFHKTGDRVVGVFQRRKKCWVNAWTANEFYFPPTHWMPLPEPPKEDAQ